MACTKYIREQNKEDSCISGACGPVADIDNPNNECFTTNLAGHALPLSPPQAKQNLTLAGSGIWPESQRHRGRHTQKIYDETNVQIPRIQRSVDDPQKMK